MEPFAGELVAEGLGEAAVDVRLGASVISVTRQEPAFGGVGVELKDGTEMTADESLFAIGRTPQTAKPGLETVGLTPGDWPRADDTCRVTAVPDGRPYAADDVHHPGVDDHQGTYRARITGTVIGARARGETFDGTRWGAHTTTADLVAVPQVVFTDPEVASVGLTTREAVRTGRRVQVVDHDIGPVAGAHQCAEGYRATPACCATRRRVSSWESLARPAGLRDDRRGPAEAAGDVPPPRERGTPLSAPPGRRAFSPAGCRARWPQVTRPAGAAPLLREAAPAGGGHRRPPLSDNSDRDVTGRSR